jgi:signal transduction histidine kinase
MDQEHEAMEAMASSRRMRELELMVQVSRTLTSTLDIERLLSVIIETAAQLVDSQGASIILEDQRTGALIFRAAAGPKSDELLNMRVPIEGSIAGTVFKTQEPLIVQDTHTDPRHYSEVDRDIQFTTQSILAVPMVFKERTIGVLEAVNKLNHGRFSEHDVQTLSTLAAQAAIAIENARLVAELKEANVRLAELDRLKSDFIAIASHELRTPLGLILGYASFLREEADGATSEELNMVLRAAMQLKGLIEDMVNLNYLEARSAILNLSECSLREIIEEAMESQGQFAATKSLQIFPSLPAVSMRVRADREKILIVLNNLLDNAIKFTPAGGRVQVAVRPQTGMVAVSVTDTGIGIPPDDLERIFERFYQVESHLTREEGGMGLGLCIARGMVELHGGRIWAESVQGRGSRFTFTLPIQWKDVVPEGA